MGNAQYFNGAENAKSMGGGQYFKGEGRFTVTPKRMFVNVGHRGKFFIAEFTVDESTSPEDPVGCTRSWAVPLEGERAQYSFGDIKNLVFALTGRNPKDVGQPPENPKLHKEATDFVMAAVDEAYAKEKKLDSSLLLDIPVHLETVKKETKKGSTFTVHRWSPCEA